MTTFTHSSKTGVVGAGLMGIGISVSVLCGGFKVILCDVSEEALVRAKSGIEKILFSLEGKRKISNGQAKVLLEQLAPA